MRGGVRRGVDRGRADSGATPPLCPPPFLLPIPGSRVREHPPTGRLACPSDHEGVIGTSVPLAIKGANPWHFVCFLEARAVRAS